MSAAITIARGARGAADRAPRRDRDGRARRRSRRGSRAPDPRRRSRRGRPPRRSATRSSRRAASCCSTASPRLRALERADEALSGPLERGPARRLSGGACESCAARSPTPSARSPRGTRSRSPPPMERRSRRSAPAPTTSPPPAPDAARSSGRARWLLIRDFRQATRFTRPGVDATTALDALEAGDLAPADAVIQIRKDLLDAYQSRLVTYLDEAVDRERARLPARGRRVDRARRRLLDDARPRVRGAARRRRARARRTARSRRCPRSARPSRASPAAVAEVKALLDRFTAAPFTPEEQARRAQQFIRFLDLIPLEYEAGVSGTEVTTPVRDHRGGRLRRGRHLGAQRPLDRARRDRSRTAWPSSRTSMEQLSGYPDDANEGGTVVPLEDVEAAHEQATAIVEEIFPEEWKESTDEADFDLIQISPRPDGGRRQRRRAADRRAGAPHRLRLLRVRPRDQAARVRPGPGARGRGIDLVRRPRRGRPRRADRRRRRHPRDPRDAPRPRRGARGRRGEDRRGRQRHDRDHELGADRLPRGARGDPDHRRDRRQPGRRQATAAQADPARRAARGPRLDRALLRRRPRTRLVLPVRREARGGGRPRRDRRALTRAQLVLPQGLLDRVDQGAPRAQQGAARRGRRRRGRERRARSSASTRSASRRLPRGLRDRALPAGAAAQLGHRDRARRRLARAGPDCARSAPRPSRSSASSPTSGC